MNSIIAWPGRGESVSGLAACDSVASILPFELFVLLGWVDACIAPVLAPLIA